MPTTQLGVAKADITPRKPLPLAGFAARQGPSEGVSHPLFVRAFFFTQDAPGGVERRALVVSADLLGWGQDRLPALRQRLRERWQLGEEAAVLSATHTHSGPQTSVRLVSSVGTPDPDYIEYLETQLFAAIEQAYTNREPITVERGAGISDIGINRRKLVDGAIRMAPNPDGPTDPAVTVLRFRTATGGTKGVLVHYTCHPTTTADRLVSSEFPGVAMAEVEETLGGGAVAAYLQGCCGDIKVALFEGDTFKRGHDADVRAVGHRLAGTVLGILSGPLHALTDRPLGGRHTSVDLPIQPPPAREQLETLRDEQGIIVEWSTLLLRTAQPPTAITLDLTRLDLADGLSLLAMNGEISVAYGLFVKERSGGHALPVAYSNGAVGYVVTAVQVAEGGYEASEAFRYYGRPGPFTPDVEPQLKEALGALVDEGRPSPPASRGTR
ncbi:MAG: neutral/alkaline non-lysosomal ceramidase N-terminal domain-containing protein [Thermomicrobiales bacterium]